MNLPPTLALAIAIVAEVIATTALKQSAGFTRPLPLALSLAGYLIALFCLSLSLEKIPTGVAYAIWSGVGIVLITALAWIVHGQKLDAPAFAGMGLIMAGVLVLNLFSKSST
ncbi:SMR family transporter [Novosphingobium sp. PASSN1]|uniref:DMT family transporter n=1 Tax=Novosphingobium sp. PASSN1 TaxID=2015561 RepID=UPI000BD7EC58|nr:SMR family transporter [Novosphingobium sp. PASSN1]OYU34845.1 MAG: QacE family quaternary ammonium compound efflux SMR transporter [Novosphingobium sp. PASSN1]